MRFLQRIHNWLKNDFSLQDPLVWVGDMNVAPSAIDVTNPEEKKNHVCFHEDVRKVYHNTVNWGLIDLFRQFNSQPDQYSFWDYRERNSFRLNIGWRIDHILCAPSLAQSAIDCYIDKEPRGWEKPSDHTPVVACFQFN
jgi:exodeoxyribonuclease-3